MQTPPRRVLGYARVSSAEQSLGTSLEDQQASITAFAKTRGLNVFRFYVESESGGRNKIERREQMSALMREVRKGDLVLVDKLDRWSRDPEFSYASVRKILEVGASMFVVSEGIDPSTREGDTTLNFRILFAREEHKRITERTVGTRNHLRDRGYYIEGTAPFGYKRPKPKGFKGLEKNILVIVPEQAELVRQMFRMSANGRPVSHIVRELGLAKHRVHKSLKSRHYLGEIRNSKGEWIKGLHPAIIDHDTFERANTLLRYRRHGGVRSQDKPPETHDWILRDIAHCGRCGAKMGAAYAGPATTRRYYYRCTQKCQSKGARVTNNSFVPVVAIERVFSEMMLARLSELREELASKRGVSPKLAAAVTDFETKREKLQKKRERIVEAHANGVTSLDDLRVALARLDAERLRLNGDEARSRAQNALGDPATRRAGLREIATLERIWGKTEGPGRRTIAAELAIEVRIRSDADPVPVWRSPEELAADLGW